MKKYKKYKLLEDYDVYICHIGRVQVKTGAEFQIEPNGSNLPFIYFLNSKNYLPSKAVLSFLKCKKEEIIDLDKNNENIEELDKDERE